MGTTTALLATGLTAFGQIQQGQQQAQAASYNAAVARQKAQAARQAGELEAERIRKQKERLTGRQKALYAKSGVTFSGSPMEVMIDSATNAEMDALITEYNYSVEASQAESQASMSRYRAGVYQRTGYMRAGQTLLTGASQSGLFDKKEK
jgi:predicted nucleotide-binding protein (sugar kinase/HSP70/actin superfamily)